MTPATLSYALDEVRGFITRYVVLTDHQAVACALWIVHTYAVDAVDITPYIAVTSPEKRSGKSLLLEVLGSLANKVWFAVRPSEAVLFRKIEKDEPTLMLDEVDTIWSTKAQNDEEGLRALLNAGFRRHGSTVPRCVGPTQKLQDFATFCPKALGGIGDLPDTISDRCIPIRMERKHREDKVERWRWKLVQPRAESLRGTVSIAAEAAIDMLMDAEPDLPDELDDRAQDAWEPLLAIADAAGGDYPTIARDAAVALMASRVEEAPIGTQLLTDIRNSFNGTGRLATKDLVTLLCDIEDSPWSDWGGKPITGRRLASMLRPYKVKPRNEGGWRGYFASDFTDAWARYAPEPHPEDAAHRAESSGSCGSCASDEEGVTELASRAVDRSVKKLTEGGVEAAQHALSTASAQNAPTAQPGRDESFPINPDDEATW